MAPRRGEKTAARNSGRRPIQVESSTEAPRADTEKFLQRLGQVLRSKREEAVLTQRELGERCNLKQSQISAVENGKLAPTVDALMMICEELKLRSSSVIQQAEGGGFVSPSLFPFSRMADSYESRLEQWSFEKHCLAEVIAEKFRTEYANQFVGIDGGTTNQYLAEAIGRDVSRGLPTVGMIVTNHIGIPERVSTGKNAPNVLLTGGVFRDDRKTLIGPAATESLKEMEFAVAVVGANGFRYPSLFTRAGLEDTVKQMFMERSNAVMLPLDPSKWGQVSGSKLKTIGDLTAQRKKVYIFGICPGNTDDRSRQPAGALQFRDTFQENAKEIIDEYKKKKRLKITRTIVKEPQRVNDIPDLTPPEDVTGMSIADIIQTTTSGRLRNVITFCIR